MLVGQLSYLLRVLKTFRFSGSRKPKVSEGIEHLPQVKSNEITKVLGCSTDVGVSRDEIEASLPSSDCNQYLISTRQYLSQSQTQLVYTACKKMFKRRNTSINSLTIGNNFPFALDPRSKTPLTTTPMSCSISQIGNVES
jgi:hypothetical protein